MRRPWPDQCCSPAIAFPCGSVNGEPAALRGASPVRGERPGDSSITPGLLLHCRWLGGSSISRRSGTGRARGALLARVNQQVRHDQRRRPVNQGDRREIPHRVAHSPVENLVHGDDRRAHRDRITVGAGVRCELDVAAVRRPIVQQAFLLRSSYPSRTSLWNVPVCKVSAVGRNDAGEGR